MRSEGTGMQRADKRPIVIGETEGRIRERTERLFDEFHAKNKNGSSRARQLLAQLGIADGGELPGAREAGLNSVRRLLDEVSSASVADKREKKITDRLENRVLAAL